MSTSTLEIVELDVDLTKSIPCDECPHSNEASWRLILDCSVCRAGRVSLLLCDQCRRDTVEWIKSRTRPLLHIGGTSTCQTVGQPATELLFWEKL